MKTSYIKKGIIAIAATMLVAPATINAAEVEGLQDFKLYLDPGHAQKENRGLYSYSEAEKTLITCPVCKKGKLIERSSKTGRRFFGCSNYPECGFSVPGEPVESVCIHCGFPLKFKKKIKDGRIVLKCGNPVCSSRRSRKYEFFVEEKVG